MTSAKKNKIRLSLFVSFSLYTILSFVISAPHLSDFSSTIDAILYALSSYWLIKLTVVLAADIFIFIYKPQPLGISDVKAGHGQHGSQQFASDEEVSHVYEKVSFGSEREPGFLVRIGWLTPAILICCLWLLPKWVRHGEILFQRWNITHASMKTQVDMEQG